MNYESTIGLEVHIQLKTKSKIWCSASADYDEQEPNTCISPTCVGEPGALPKLNDEVLNYAIKAALALGCSINQLSFFDRKNYFYPDSPKNYQITQFFKPYAENGELKIVTNSGKESVVKIERIQIEEDTAKSIHLSSESLLNFNRASMPLLEIITTPCISNSEQAYAYLTTLKERIKYTKVSDVSMELGSLRCDANVSVKKKGETKLGTRTETKNLNSFKAVVKAIEYEINRQIDVIENGGRVIQETRLWDEENGVTRTMRSKEDAMDYRYFPEPDLPPVVISDERLEKVKKDMPEFSDEKMSRFISQYNIPEVEARILTNEPELANYFEKVATEVKDARMAANWILTEVLRVLKEKNCSIEEFNIREDRLADLIHLIKNKTISSKIAKDIFEKMLEIEQKASEIVKKEGLAQITDSKAIEELVDKVLAENEASVADLKAGKDRAMKYLMGQAMKLSKGKANPKQVSDLILEKCK